MGIDTEDDCRVGVNASLDCNAVGVQPPDESLLYQFRREDIASEPRELLTAGPVGIDAKNAIAKRLVKNYRVDLVSSVVLTATLDFRTLLWPARSEDRLLIAHDHTEAGRSSSPRSSASDWLGRAIRRHEDYRSPASMVSPPASKPFIFPWTAQAKPRLRRCRLQVISLADGFLVGVW
jgi:hypothetical protein